MHELAITYDATGRKNGEQFIHIGALSRWTAFLICAFGRRRIADRSRPAPRHAGTGMN